MNKSVHSRIATDYYNQELVSDEIKRKYVHLIIGQKNIRRGGAHFFYNNIYNNSLHKSIFWFVIHGSSKKYGL